MAKTIRYDISHQLPCILRIIFESVPVKNLNTLEAKLFDVLEKVTTDGVDMNRMLIVVARAVNRRLLSVERWPFYEISKMLKNEAVYGSLDGETLKKAARDIVYYQNLSAWGSDQWIALLQKYPLPPTGCANNRWWLQNPHASIIGKPSAQLAKTLVQNEFERVEARREKLGEDGLTELNRALEQARHKNDKLAPQELIDTFQIPEIRDVSFIHVVHAVASSSGARSEHHGEVENYLDLDPSRHRLNAVFSQIPSQFVTISLYITTKGLPKHLLPLIPLYLDLFFALPIERNGELIQYETVVSEITQGADEYTATVGVQDITEVLCITLRAKTSQYREVVSLLKGLFLHSVFDPKRYDGCRMSLL